MKTPLRRKVRTAVFFLSCLLFPWTVNWFSPYLSVAGAWSGVVSGSVLVFAVLGLTAPFLGRSFCSWICPGGAVQEAIVGTSGRKPGGPASWRIKWFVWAPWLVLLASGWASAGLRALVPEWTPGFPNPQDFLSSLGAGTVMATAVSGLFLLLALAFGRRGACHTVCWMAPFLILGRAAGQRVGLPGLRLEASAEGCVACQKCTTACPMGVPVQTLVQKGRMEHRECILCADCVDSCPRTVLKLGFGR